MIKRVVIHIGPCFNYIISCTTEFLFQQQIFTCYLLKNWLIEFFFKFGNLHPNYETEKCSTKIKKSCVLVLSIIGNNRGWN